MASLKLILKRKWYDLIASGMKNEEYREVTPYWLKRLFLYDTGGLRGHLVPLTDVFWRDFLPVDDRVEALKDLLERGILVPKHRDIVFSHGYSKERPSFRAVIDGIRIGEGTLDLGAEPGKEYFVIRVKWIHRVDERIIGIPSIGTLNDWVTSIEQDRHITTVPEDVLDIMKKVGAGYVGIGSRRRVHYYKVDGATARACVDAVPKFREAVYSADSLHNQHVKALIYALLNSVQKAFGYGSVNFDSVKF